tara:strand:+ start:836 stop:1228 length:393 start_codon:yes stop_codon:yes gene_type:complete
MSKEEISEWLDTEFDFMPYPLSFSLKNNMLTNYYKENDRNLKINNLKAIDYMITNNMNQQKYIQVYMTKNNEEYYHYLNHNTPRYQANMIFNKMIDYCLENKLLDDKKNPIVNKFLRNSFYQYCYENSNY